MKTKLYLRLNFSYELLRQLISSGVVQLANQKIKHTELGDSIRSGSHTIFLPEEVSLHVYLLANPVFNMVVKIVTVRKIHYAESRCIY